jgi:PAS domain S-box-containing protein
MEIINNLKAQDIINKLQEMAHIGIWEWDIKRNKVTWSDELYRIYGLKKGEFGASFEAFLEMVFPDEREKVKTIIETILKDHQPVEYEERIVRPDGSIRVLESNAEIVRDEQGNPTVLRGYCHDITVQKEKIEAEAQAARLEELNKITLESEEKIKEENKVNETLYRIGKALSAEFELEKIVQTVTDECTSLSRAQFGAFFYNVLNEKGENYMLYTISGVPREEFSKFPMPRNTEIFSPTFNGEGIVRLDDVTLDPRYGKKAPYYGMPTGHLPVKSYLAVPVISRTGEVIGGLFFGHPKAGVFTENAEKIIFGIASQAAVAIDNSRLYQKTREDEIRFRLLSEAVPQMIWTGEANGYIDYYNPVWYEYSGLTFDQVKKGDWINVFHPEDLDEMREIWANALKNGIPFELKARMKRSSDGTYRWHLYRGLPVKNEEGNVERWFGTGTDIDDQVRSGLTQKYLAEAGALLGSSLDYETTLKNIANMAVPGFADWAAVDLVKENKIVRLAVAHKDPSKIKLAKELAKKYPPNIDAPTGLPNVIRTGVSEFVEDIPDSVIEESPIDEESKQLVREIGIKSYMIVPLKVNGRVIGGISFVTEKANKKYTANDLLIAEDLGRRASMAIENAGLYSQLQHDKENAEQIKEQLRIANIELENSNQDLQNFAYVASHDLQEPLRTISSYTSLIERRYKDKIEEEDKEFFEIITEAAKRMRNLIDNLLEYSRIGKNEFSEVNLNETVKNIISNLKVAIEESQAFINCENLPVIKAESSQMLQLFQNIISNSIKYRSDKKPVINISFHEKPDDWLFSISDNGIGIDPKYYEKIFVIFQRLHDKNQFKGTGIGLATCKKIVELHQGDIWLESGEGKGTTFFFTISKNLQ